MDPRPGAGKNPLRWLIVAVLLPGLILAAWRCHLRLAIEESDRFVEIAVSYEEVRSLARARGLEPRVLLAAMAAEGIGAVGIAEDTLQTLEHEGRLSVLSAADQAWIDGVAGSKLPELGPGQLLLRSDEPGLLARISRILEIKSPGLTELEDGGAFLVLRGAGTDMRERVGLGFSQRLLGEASALGLGVILRPVNHPGMTASGIQALVETWPPPASLSAIVFAEEEVLGARGDLAATALALRGRSQTAPDTADRNAVGQIASAALLAGTGNDRCRDAGASNVVDRLGQVEFLDQSGMPELLARLGRAVPVVRVHSIGRRELDENYDVARATARWIRAVRDRRLKLLYIRFFLQDPKRIMDDPIALNLGYVRGIIGGLRAAGFVTAKTDEQRRREPRARLGALPSWARVPIALALLSGLPLLLGFSRRRGLSFQVAAGWSAVNLTLAVWLPAGLLNGLAGLFGAIGYSTLGTIWAVRVLDPADSGKQVPRPISWSAWAGFLTRLVLPSLLGGVLIAGLHAESTYLLHIEQFRGIKAAFLVPLLWVGLWSLRRYGSSLLAIFSRPLRMGDLFLAIVVIGGTALYLARSGNVTFLKPSATEDMIRTWLENLLTARPRNKEFLIGYPAALFFLAFQARAARALLPLWVFFLTMGQVSLLNTFCHFHSPLALAFLRGWNGLWAGLLIGGTALFLYQVCRFLAGFARRDGDGVLIGYFGFGNLGDELLWRTFTEQARRARPELRWRVLAAGPGDGAWPEGVRPLYRSHPGELLETLSNARCVVIPGGGVLQSSTSLSSLWYYSLLAAIGTVGNGCLLLPAQGLGPWGTANPEPGKPGAGVEVPAGAALPGTVAVPAGRGAEPLEPRQAGQRCQPCQSAAGRAIPGDGLRGLLAWLMGRARHVSVRDAVSREAFDRLGTGVAVPVATDAVFLLLPPPAASERLEAADASKGSQGANAAKGANASEGASASEGRESPATLESPAAPNVPVPPDALEPSETPKAPEVPEASEVPVDSSESGTFEAPADSAASGRSAAPGAMAGRRLRLGAVLRGSRPDSARIALLLRDWAAAHDLELVPLTFQPGEDEAPWRGISGLAEPRTLRAGASLWHGFEGLDLLVCMRLHGAILATIAGIPWLGLTYDPKVEGLARELGWPHVTAPEMLGVDTLQEFLLDVRGRGGELSATLRKAAGERRKRALEDSSACLRQTAMFGEF